MGDALHKLLVMLETLGPAFVAVSMVAVLVWLIIIGLGYVRSKDNQSGFISSVMGRLVGLEKENQRLQVEVNRLRISEIRLRHDLDLMASAHNDLPWAAWLKSTDGVMLSVNQAYVDRFLTPRGFARNDYVGKNDTEIWPDSVAKAFKQNDLKVLQTGDYLDFIERVPGQDGVEDLRFLKFVRRSNGTPVGVAGMLIPVQPKDA